MQAASYRVETMRAMELRAKGTPLVAVDRAVPRAGTGQIVVAVEACGVCRTDLHVVDGELPDPRLPLVPGHEIVGTIVRTGNDASGLRVGQRVGIPWLAFTCSTCRYCRSGQENLCEFARFTGYTVDGGYAEYALADARYCFPLPAERDPLALAPWLCAGLIGYRALRFAGDATRLGIYGFGAAAHMIAQVCRHQHREVFAFTRSGDEAAQAFARALGAVWTGDSDQKPPFELDAAILFAPVGALVPKALRHLRKGGRVICAGIHMSNIPSFPYEILWGERSICSVANLTRQDAIEFIALADRANIESTVTPYALSAANEALASLRAGTIVGAAVLDPKR
jgi:propanol-preferring alcohol dehydrogenase